MKRFFGICLAIAVAASVTACGNKQDGSLESTVTQDSGADTETRQADTEARQADTETREADTETRQADTETWLAEQNELVQTQAVQEENEQIENSRTENNQTEAEEESGMKMNIKIGDNVLTATLVQNSSTEALIEMLSEGSVTIEMSDYAGMEKVGPFPRSLPTNDEQISTGAGDLILYMGNSFVIYYDTNSWNFTRLGKIDNITQQELMDVLGDGGVTAVLSLPEE